MGLSTTEKNRSQPLQVKAGRAFASHSALIRDMREFQTEVTQSRDTALAFLKRAGLVTASGKPKQLIRG